MMKFTGVTDLDFMSHMRATHQGAIDMAKIVLANGKVAEIKKPARDIITAQEKEIATINVWPWRKEHRASSSEETPWRLRLR